MLSMGVESIHPALSFNCSVCSEEVASQRARTRISSRDLELELRTVGFDHDVLHHQQGYCVQKRFLCHLLSSQLAWDSLVLNVQQLVVCNEEETALPASEQRW